MTNEVAVQKTFQEKMADRVRDGMGDLLSDEDLAKLVEQAIQQEFFAQRIVPAARSWDSPTKVPSLFVETVMKCLQASLEKQVEIAVGKWATEHPEKFAEAFQASLGAGIFSAVVRHIDSLSQAHTATTFSKMVEQLRANGVKI